MNDLSVFGKATQAKVDNLQKKEDYKKCYELYCSSSLDVDNPQIRNIKLIFYRILADYVMYDPQIEKILSYSDVNPDFSIFTSISKSDPLYVNKMRAILLVLYYSIKNRVFNYALQANASHDDVSKCEYLREWLEKNAQDIANGSEILAELISATMVLLYDKILGATVELVHAGKDVPTSVTTYDMGNGYAYSKVNYTNTTKVHRVNALKLKMLDDYREEFIERKNYWKENISDPILKSLKNSFLHGTYDLNKINSCLSEFNFKLFNISTKYYENYFSHFINPLTISFGQFSKIFYLLTGNDRKLDDVTKKHRDWPLGLIIKSFIKSFLFAIPIALLVMVITTPLGEQTSMIISIIFGCMPFLPPFNRMLEKKKRAKYNIVK